jgi:HEAT repeat protein
MPLRCAVLSVVVLVVLPIAVGAQDKAIPEDLLKQIKDEDADTRVRAIMGLSKLGVEAVPVLVELLRDKEVNVSNAAAYGLQLLKIEPAERIAALKPFAADKSPEVRGGVASALARGGPDAVAVLVPFLKDEEPAVRKKAVLSLQAIVQKDKEARVGEMVVPEFEKALQDESAPVRLVVVQALPFCGPKSIPVLIKALDDMEAKIRATASSALSKPAFKELAGTFLGALTKRLASEEEVIVKQSLLSTLSKCGPEALPAIRKSLADMAPEVQKAALYALGQLGEEAKPALAEVKELAVKAEHPEVRKGAISLLPRFGAEGVSAVLALLKSDDSATRLACLQVVGKQGGATAADVANLAACLKDKDEGVRALAAFVLGKLGPDAKAALPELEKLREEKNEQVRAVAEKAIKSIGGK